MRDLQIVTLPNKQPAEKPDYAEDGSLDVMEVFDTIQGEGPFAGEPAVFVRLAGCTLVCPGCDTIYTGSGRKRLAIPDLCSDIFKYTNSLSDRRLIVVTGGEPFRQNLGPFARLALSADHRVQIETNGTLAPDDFPWLMADVVCSPKAGKVHPTVQAWCRNWKYVLQAGEVDPADGLPTSVLGNGVRPFRLSDRQLATKEHTVWVQPMDEGDPERNAANTRAAVESCMKFGYRLSIQTHKIAGVP